MKDFLDLIIFLLIIYAILAPLLKKKTPFPDREEEELNFPKDDHAPDSKEKPTQGVLEEIENLFDYEEKLNDIPILIEDTEILEDRFERNKTEFPFTKESSSLSQVSRKTQEKFDNETSLHYSEEMSGFDYNSIDEEIETFDYSSDFENTEQDKEELKTFTFNIAEPDDFKRAIIYKEIFDMPVSVKLIRAQWRRNIYSKR